ncbi:hypothetical protein [Prauserella cavernicola]|uniref:hypothetical protein n=1 Tax=Prauserella cavernicola TaxID=2800127 RepID=UPI0027DC46B7|nr:hypothetical protein [Prauserella cavernicola]
MTGGFGAVPEELRQAAGKIDDVAGGVLQLLWRGPSGEYGHSGVQRGWADFIENAQRQVEILYGKATEHGEGLRVAAGRYLANEADVGGVVDGLGDLLDGDGLDPSVVPGGGFAGGIADVLSSAGQDETGDAPGGVMSPQRARALAESQGMDKPDTDPAGHEDSGIQS